MDMATNAIMGAAYGAAGERCMALSVVLAVGDKTADELCSRLEKQIAALRVGPGLIRHRKTKWDRLSPRVHRNKVLGYIDSGESQGASLRVDGRRFSVKGQ
ncbi:Methylmalonate semialdehyde dehydrogenase [acylating] [Citrobacter freundii]|nr:Methylmalonate semialdehyde dehydrogenase [acylating] [Citrobacter freundii]